MHQLKLTPVTESGKKELTGDEVYWYPLKVIDNNILMSVDLTTESTYSHLKERWTRGGRIIVSSPINERYECFLYFGTIGDPRIVPIFKERPLLVKSGCIYYSFPDYDFDNIYREINSMENKLSEDDASIRTKQKLCLDFFENYFSHGWDLSLRYVKPKRIDRDVEKYGFHTNKIGLHPLLHLIQLIPDKEWDVEYYKQMFIFLFKNDFLVSWIDNIENSDEKEAILQKCEKFSNGEITTIPEFKNVLKKITKQLVNKHEFFGVLYLAAQCANQSSVFKALFNNLFELVPKEQKEWIGYPKFQPKLIVDDVELHFIQKARSLFKIKNMTNDLNRIFDEVNFYGLRDYRYRFICKVRVSIWDYSLIPNRIGAIYDAVRTIARENHLSELTKEMWVKRIAVRFITPPQFEDDVLLAFSKNWFFRRKPKALDELDEENRRKTLRADIICDYSVYQDGEFVLPFKYSQDVQSSYVALNNLLFKNHNFTQFGEMNPPKE